MTMRTYTVLGVCLVAAATGCSGLSSSSKSEPKPSPSAAPWADSQPNWADFTQCPDLDVNQVKTIFGSEQTPKLMNADQEDTYYGENGYLECAYHDAKDYRRQLVYQNFRLAADSGPEESGQTYLDKLYGLRQEPNSASPLDAKYSGFGVHNQMNDKGSQTALWACGNQGLTLALTTPQPQMPDKSADLWKQLEPAIAKTCGTADSPTAPIANNKGQRIDSVKSFAEARTLDVPALDAKSSTNPQTASPPRPNASLANQVTYKRRLDGCPTISPSYFAAPLKADPKLVQVVLKEARRDWRGEFVKCLVIIPSHKDHQYNSATWELEYRPYSYEQNATIETAEEFAKHYSSWGTRHQQLAQYQGFGVGLFARDGISFRWFCRNYSVTLKLDSRNRNDWAHRINLDHLVQPTVSKVCGTKHHGTSLPFDQDMRRVDYTQLLIDDWRLESSDPETSPPKNRRYLGWVRK